MNWLGAGLVLLSALGAVCLSRQGHFDRSRFLTDCTAAFRQLARMLQASSPPVQELLRQLPEGAARDWLAGRRSLPPLGHAQEDLLREAKSLIGRYDAATQAAGLLRVADRLEELLRQQEQNAADRKVREAIWLCGVLAAVILLL